MPLGQGQGLSLIVEDRLRGLLALGVLEAEGIAHDPLPPAFLAERDELLARLNALHGARAITDVPGVAETRSLFHRLDIDPTKTRPSSEALLRRALQGKGLPEVDPAVDVCNLCSLDHQLPLGLYDRGLVRGDLRVRVGRDGEGYAGIRKTRVNVAGRLTIADDEGPFGAPTSDSLRTAVTLATRDLLVVWFCPVERPPGDLSAALEQLADRLTRYCGATVAAVRVLR